MPRTDTVTPRTRTLAASIRTVRTDAKFGLRELARRIGISPQLLSQWEHGLRTPRVEDVTAILGALGVIGDRKQQIVTLAKGAAEPGWITYGTPGIPHQLAAVIECEKAAESIVEWSPLGIPGLLQTPAYARATFNAFGLDPRTGRQELAARLQRQQLLAGPTFRSAGRRSRIAGPDRHSGHDVRPVALTGREAAAPTITVRVVPASAAGIPASPAPSSCIR